MTDDGLRRRITMANERVYLKLILPETTYKSNPDLRHLLRNMVNFISKTNYIVGNGLLIHPKLVITTTYVISNEETRK